MVKKYQKTLKGAFKDPSVLYSFLDNLSKHQVFGSDEESEYLILLLTETEITSPVSLYNYIFEQILNDGKDIKPLEFAYRADWISKMIRGLSDLGVNYQEDLIIILTKVLIFGDFINTEQFRLMLANFHKNALTRLGKEAECIRKEALENGKIIPPLTDCIIRQLAKESPNIEYFNFDNIRTIMQGPFVEFVQSSTVKDKVLYYIPMERLGHTVFGEIVNHDEISFENYDSYIPMPFLSISV